MHGEVTITMSKPVPPSVFFGRRTTRAQSKAIDNDPATPRDTRSTLKTSKTNKKTCVEATSSAVTRGRTLRPVLKDKLDAPAVTSTNNEKRSVQSRKRRVQEKQPQPTTAATESVQLSTSSPAVKTRRTSRKASAPPVKKNPVYKQVIVEIKPKEDNSRPVSDEYEFQADSLEETVKKVKKKRQRPKVQTLWGLTIKSNAKKATRPATVVRFEEPENLKPFGVDTQTKNLHKNPPGRVKKTCVPLQERAGNTLSPKVTSNIESHKEQRTDLPDDIVQPDNSNKIVNKSLQQGSKGKADKCKENIPITNKRPIAAMDMLTITPFKERPVGSNGNSTPLRSISTPNPIQIMKLALSPIHGSQKITATPSRCRPENSLISSSPKVAAVSKDPVTTPRGFNDSHKENKDPCIGRSSHFGDEPMPMIDAGSEEQPSHCIPEETSAQNEPCSNSHSSYHQDKNLSSSSTQNKTNGSLDDGLFDTSNIFKDIPKHAKFSVPARLLPSIAPTRATIRPPQLGTIQDRFEESSIQGLNDLTIDNCFGFTDDSNEVFRPAYVQPPHLTVHRRHYDTSKFPAIEEVKKMLESGLPKSKEAERKAEDDAPSSMTVSELPSNDAEKSPSRSFSLILTSSDSEDDVTFNKQDSSVPLFEDITEKHKYKSPFTKPAERSYLGRRFKRTVRKAESSDEEEEPEKVEPVKRKQATYRRTKKMVQTTLIDQWAKNLSSHFAEVEDTDLLVE